MIKNSLKFISFFLLLYLASCENEHVVEVDSIFTEYTVVQSEIRAGDIFPGVRFTKTLPLGIPYDITEAELKNITAYIKLNNDITKDRIIPIYYTQDGLYKALEDTPRVRQGSTYELFAKRNETFIYSKTYIPRTPNVTGTDFNSNNHSLEANVLSAEHEVYAAIWRISSTASAENFFSVSETTYPNSIVTVRTSSIPEEYMSSVYNGSRYIQVYSFDKAFKPYFNSRTSGQSIDNPLVQSGGSIQWNVTGDHVIGMFIGVCAGSQIPVQ